MAISKSYQSKGAEVAVQDFVMMKGKGSTRGTGSGGSGNPKSGPMREQVMGKPKLSGKQTP